MNIDEARRVIDRAWHSAPASVDWNEIEEASMVIVAETGKPYDPEEEERKERNVRLGRMRFGAPPPGVTLEEMISEMAETDRAR